MEKEPKIRKCVVCGKETILGDMFYDDGKGSRITISVCEDCMNKDLINTLKRDLFDVD